MITESADISEINDPTALNPEIPVTATTATARRSDRGRCLEAGMNDFIAKPIDRVQMIEVIARLLEARGVAPGK